MGGKPLALSHDEVRHIATLCRIGMTQEELDSFAQQLSRVLELFQVLQGLDTQDVPPTGHAVSLETVMRDDEPQPSGPAAEALANAPKREGDLFRVKVVLGEYGVSDP